MDGLEASDKELFVFSLLIHSTRVKSPLYNNYNTEYAAVLAHKAPLTIGPFTDPLWLRLIRICYTLILTSGSQTVVHV